MVFDAVQVAVHSKIPSAHLTLMAPNEPLRVIFTVKLSYFTLCCSFSLLAKFGFSLFAFLVCRHRPSAEEGHEDEMSEIDWV